MKKFTIIILAIVICLSFGRAAFAQNATREQFSAVFSEYRSKYDEYTQLHDQYILSKKQYEQFKTLSAKENLQRDLQKMLVKRDEVLVAYYNSLISKMDDSLITMPLERKNEFTQKLNGEIGWLNDHKTSYQVNDSPQTLSVKSEEVDTHFQAFWEDLYKSLYYIARGKMETYSGRYNFLYNDLYSLTEKIKNEQRDAYKFSDSKIETIDRWFGEINLKSDDFVKLLDQADTQIEKASGKSSKGMYDASIKILNKALNVFIDRITNTKEIITEIKVSES